MSVKTQIEMNQIDSSTSMQPINNSKTKTRRKSELRLLPNENSLVGAEPESESPDLISRPAKLAYENPDFRLAWQNQFKFHVSLNLLRLRRFNRMSQTQLAKAMHTSQPMIARLESGEENFTADTLERAVNALDGRIDISISPAQLNLPPRNPWWEALAGAWDFVGMRVSVSQVGDDRIALVLAGFRQEGVSTDPRLISTSGA